MDGKSNIVRAGLAHASTDDKDFVLFGVDEVDFDAIKAINGSAERR